MQSTASGLTFGSTLATPRSAPSAQLTSGREIAWSCICSRPTSRRSIAVNHAALPSCGAVRPRSTMTPCSTWRQRTSAQTALPENKVITRNWRPDLVNAPCLRFIKGSACAGTGVLHRQLLRARLNALLFTRRPRMYRRHLWPKGVEYHHTLIKHNRYFA